MFSRNCIIIAMKRIFFFFFFFQRDTGSTNSANTNHSKKLHQWVLYCTKGIMVQATFQSLGVAI